MPRVPQYQLRGNIPAGVGFPLLSVEKTALSGPVALTKTAGKIIEDRSKQLIREYDASVVTDAYNEFRDLARTKLTELFARESGSAMGVQNDYNTWYETNYPVINDKHITNNDQATMFKELTNRRRVSDLDALARHEVTQFRQYKKEKLEGLISDTLHEMRLNAWNDVHRESAIATVDEKIEDFLQGSSHEFIRSVQRKYHQAFREAAMKKMIFDDPVDAEKYLDLWQIELGDQYGSLKKLLDNKLEEEVLELAFDEVMLRYGNNLEAGLDFVNSKRGKNKLNLDYDMQVKLDARISGLIQDRDRREKSERDDEERRVKDNGFQARLDLYEGKITAEDILKMAQMRNIDEEDFESLIQRNQEGPPEDNIYVYADLHEKMLRNASEFREDLVGARKAGQITNETFVAMSKTSLDNDRKAGAAYISRAVKPGDLEKWDKDKNLRYAEAMRLYEILLADGMDFATAAITVVDRYTDQIRRTIRGFATPQYLEGDINDSNAMAQAMLKTAEAYDKGQIGVNQYNFEINNLRELIKMQDELNQAELEDVKAAKQELKNRMK